MKVTARGIENGGPEQIDDRLARWGCGIGALICFIALGVALAIRIVRWGLQ